MEQLELFPTIYKVAYKTHIWLYNNKHQIIGLDKEHAEYHITKGLMNINQATSFVDFITKKCNDYAGWYNIINTKKQPNESKQWREYLAK